MRRRQALITLVLAAGAAVAEAAPGQELYVVVNAKVAVPALGMRDAVALFTGRVRTFPDGGEAEPFDQAEDSAARASFYRSLTGMDLARINSYWARLRFSGQVQPPKFLGDDKEVIAMVKANPRAIGYLRSAPADPTLRVVLVLPVVAP